MWDFNDFGLTWFVQNKKQIQMSWAPSDSEIGKTEIKTFPAFSVSFSQSESLFESFHYDDSQSAFFQLKEESILMQISV